MKLLIALLLAISSVTSWGCHSWGCRTVTKRCWRPSCGFRSYLTNRDYFLYWWKPAVVSLKLVPSKWRSELAKAKAENAEDIAALQQEIDEVKADNEALAQSTNAEISSLKGELADAQAEIDAVRAEAADSVAAARQELIDYKVAQKKKQLKWEDLNSELRSDVESLRTMLYDHKRDDLRSVVLWPSGCGWRCADNYKYVYSIWSRLSTRLEKKYAVKWVHLPCNRRLRVMRRTFLNWCDAYPRRIRVKLVGYYDYLFAGRGCSW